MGLSSPRSLRIASICHWGASLPAMMAAGSPPDTLSTAKMITASMNRTGIEATRRWSRYLCTSTSQLLTRRSDSESDCTQNGMGTKTMPQVSRYTTQRSAGVSTPPEKSMLPHPAARVGRPEAWPASLLTGRSSRLASPPGSSVIDSAYQPKGAANSQRPFHTLVLR